MMREIKFRIWDLSLKRMEAVESMAFGKDGVCDANVTIIPDEAILMQFTGLKDKNGVDIYEGDVLKWGHINEIVEVYFNDSECVFVGRPIDHNKETESWLDNQCEVIGNIHQHKHLLT